MSRIAIIHNSNNRPIWQEPMADGTRKMNGDNYLIHSLGFRLFIHNGRQGAMGQTTFTSNPTADSNFRAIIGDTK